VMFGCFHLFVVFAEEPMLGHNFGEAYQRYCRSIHRWVPAKRYRVTGRGDR
jgi:protein-S-isoprenylcysteine O-methyltransferase Ste14